MQLGQVFVTILLSLLIVFNLVKCQGVKRIYNSSAKLYVTTENSNNNNILPHNHPSQNINYVHQQQHHDNAVNENANFHDMHNNNNQELKLPLRIVPSSSPSQLSLSYSNPNLLNNGYSDHHVNEYQQDHLLPNHYYKQNINRQTPLGYDYLNSIIRNPYLYLYQPNQPQHNQDNNDYDYDYERNSNFNDRFKHLTLKKYFLKRILPDYFDDEHQGGYFGGQHLRRYGKVGVAGKIVGDLIGVLIRQMIEKFGDKIGNYAKEFSSSGFELISMAINDALLNFKNTYFNTIKNTKT